VYIPKSEDSEEMAMAGGFYNQPRPVIPTTEGPEGAGNGKPGATPLPQGSATPVSSASLSTPVQSTGFSTLNSVTRGGSAGAGANPGGGAQTLTIPRSLAGNPLVAGATAFASNSPPDLRANCAAIGKFIAANPDKTSSTIDTLLSAKIENGEIVIPPLELQEPAGATSLASGPAAPASGNSTALASGPASASSADSTAPAARTLASGPAAPAVGNGTTPLASGPAAPASAASSTLSGGAFSTVTSADSSDQQAIQNMGVMPAGGDISEMCFVVLMDATNDQDQDLELIMAQTKAQTAAKQALRDVIAKVGRDVAANAAQQVDDANGNPIAPNPPTTFPGTGDASGGYYSAAPIPVPDPNAEGGYDTVNTVLWTPPAGDQYGITYNDLKSMQDNLNGQLDSMNEMSEMTSMRLQMAMDRRSKFVEALSNVMKKIDSTQETIVQNLKG
jgi:hypothetical protein